MFENLVLKSCWVVSELAHTYFRQSPLVSTKTQLDKTSLPTHSRTFLIKRQQYNEASRRHATFKNKPVYTQGTRDERNANSYTKPPTTTKPFRRVHASRSNEHVLIKW